MKLLLLFVLLILTSPTYSHGHRTDTEFCMDFISKDNNHKTAHKNKHCLRAANEGSHSAQYSVGMGYGYSGNHILEEIYYRLSAEKRNIAAYLGLGHLMNKKNDGEALYWYKKYITSIRTNKIYEESEAYVALLIADIYKRNGDLLNMDIWIKEGEKASSKREL